MPVLLNPNPPPATPADRYATLADWDNWAGDPNVVSYTDKAGSGELNAAAAQAAMDYADEQIDYALSSVYATPLVFNGGAVTPQVRYWATVIGVGRFAYMGRGQADSDKVGDKFSKLVRDVYKEMRQALGPTRQLPCQLRAGVSFAASSIDVQAARNSVRPVRQRVWGGW